MQPEDARLGSASDGVGEFLSSQQGVTFVAEQLRGFIKSDPTLSNKLGAEATPAQIATGLAAAFDAQGQVVVHGGYGETGDVGADAEAFDIRAHRWRPVDLAHSAQTQYYGQNGAGRTRWYLDRAQHGLVFTVV